MIGVVRESGVWPDIWTFSQEELEEKSIWWRDRAHKAQTREKTRPAHGVFQPEHGRVSRQLLRA